MNKTRVFNQFDTVLHDATNIKLQKKLDKLETILHERLGDKYQDLVTECINRQRYDVRTVLKLTASRKTRIKREIDPDTRCMARIGLGSQCSRSRINNSNFCKSHHISRRYGRIDVPEGPEKKIAKRRGRRSKHEKDYTIEDLDINRYVQAILVNINDEPYLIDQNNILYQFNSVNEIVGFVVDDKVEWY